MPTFKDVTAPSIGQAITISGGRLSVPDQPVIPFIEGDGTGPDIWRASVRVFDAAVDKAYGKKKKILAQFDAAPDCKVRATPVAANDTLFLLTENEAKLYAIASGAKEKKNDK